MKCQKIHEYIWNAMLAELRVPAEKSFSPRRTKEKAAKQLLDGGYITQQAYHKLATHHFCVACVLYKRRCYRCPLKNCGKPDSLYLTVVYGPVRDAIDAASKIRDTKIHKILCNWPAAILLEGGKK